MRKYSLITELYPRAPFEDTMLTEALMDKGTFKDAIQYLIGAAAEYGLGAITLPAAGAGLAVGPVTETIVDVLFAVDEIKQGVETIQAIKDKMGKYKGLIEDAFNSYGAKDFSTFYSNVRDIVQEAFGDFGNSSTAETIEDIVEQVKEALQEVIDAGTSSIEQGIKTIIPDATIALGAAKAVGAILSNIAENPYDNVVSAIEKVDIFAEFVQDPSICIDFFEDVLQQLYELMEAAIQKMQDDSDINIKNMLTKGPGGIMMGKLGSEGLSKALDWLKETIPMVMDVIKMVLEKVIPVMMSTLALLQIFLQGEYKQDDSDGDGDVDQADEMKEKLEKVGESRYYRELRRLL